MRKGIESAGQACISVTSDVQPSANADAAKFLGALLQQTTLEHVSEMDIIAFSNTFARHRGVTHLFRAINVPFFILIRPRKLLASWQIVLTSRDEWALEES